MAAAVRGAWTLPTRSGRSRRAARPAFGPSNPDAMPLKEKIETVATEIYGAAGVDFQPGVTAELERLESFGLANAPVCIAKTQYSFSDNPALLGRPRGFRIAVREVTPFGGRGVRGGEDGVDHDDAGAGGEAGRAGDDDRRGRGDRGVDVGPTWSSIEPDREETP